MDDNLYRSPQTSGSGETQAERQAELVRLYRGLSVALLIVFCGFVTGILIWRALGWP